MRWCPRLLAALVAFVLVALPGVSDAFTVKVHIFLANSIRDNLVQNWNESGRPRIKLLQPDGRPPRYVVLPQQDAEAIRDYPEFFRGGAIGPDNTVAPGLTDPSHAWTFAPFSQCQALLEESRTQEERAYALGCFLHGSSDNSAHHMVNFFTGETFTLFPVDAAQDGELHWSLLNVVRHILTEGRFETAIETTQPGTLAPELMQHRIAVDLYRRVFLARDNGRGMWRWFEGSIVQRKNEALAAARLDGLDPNRDLELSIEQIREQGLGRRLDDRIFRAYVDFLKTGAPVEVLGQTYDGGPLTPADYVLLLPEIVEDIRRFLAMVDMQGEDDLRVLEAQGCGLNLTCQAKLRLYRYLYKPDESGTSRMDRAIATKNRELDGIVTAYVQTVERMSNMVVQRGVGGASAQEVSWALQPLTDALGAVTSFPYHDLFPAWAAAVLDNVQWLRSFMDACFDVMKNAIKAQIVDFLAKHMEELRVILAQLTPDVLRDLKTSIDQLRANLRERLDEAKLRAVGLDMTPADGMIAQPTLSVWAMNAFNTVAGALANEEVVFRRDPTGFYGGGPVSFDASFQLEYNQLAVCDDLRDVFYPCGTSASEMLQPDYRRCQALPAEARIDPPVECHNGSASQFLAPESTSIDDCARRTVDQIVDYDEGHRGSYTGAFPPRYVANGPTCIDPFGDIGASGGSNGSGDFERRGAGLGGEGSATFFGDAGCNLLPRETGAAPGAAFAALLVVALVVGRRRSR